LDFVHYEFVEILLIGHFDHNKYVRAAQHAFDILTPGMAATARATSRALPGPTVMTT